MGITVNSPVMQQYYATMPQFPGMGYNNNIWNNFGGGLFGTGCYGVTPEAQVGSGLGAVVSTVVTLGILAGIGSLKNNTSESLESQLKDLNTQINTKIKSIDKSLDETNFTTHQAIKEKVYTDRKTKNDAIIKSATNDIEYYDELIKGKTSYLENNRKNYIEAHSKGESERNEQETKLIKDYESMEKDLENIKECRENSEKRKKAAEESNEKAEIDAEKRQAKIDAQIEEINKLIEKRNELKTKVDNKKEKAINKIEKKEDKIVSKLKGITDAKDIDATELNDCKDVNKGINSAIKGFLTTTNKEQKKKYAEYLKNHSSEIKEMGKQERKTLELAIQYLKLI